MRDVPGPRTGQTNARRRSVDSHRAPTDPAPAPGRRRRVPNDIRGRTRCLTHAGARCGRLRSTRRSMPTSSPRVRSGSTSGSRRATNDLSNTTRSFLVVVYSIGRHVETTTTLCSGSATHCHNSGGGVEAGAATSRRSPTTVATIRAHVATFRDPARIQALDVVDGDRNAGQISRRRGSGRTIRDDPGCGSAVPARILDTVKKLCRLCVAWAIRSWRGVRFLD